MVDFFLLVDLFLDLLLLLVVLVLGLFLLLVDFFLDLLLVDLFLDLLLLLDFLADLRPLVLLRVVDLRLLLVEDVFFRLSFLRALS